MYSEGIDRLTVYGSSNIETKLKTKLYEDTLYSVSFCESGSSIFEDFGLDKESTLQQVLDYLDYRFAIIDFKGFKGFEGACKIKLVNTDYTIEIVVYQ